MAARATTSAVPIDLPTAEEMKPYLSCLIVVFALAGCAASGPVELSTEGLGSHQVATLNPVPPPVSVLIHIDRQRPGNCFTNCSFYRPVRVKAGKHMIQMEVFAPGLPSDKDKPTVPAERVAEAKQLTSPRGGILVSSFTLDEQEFAFDAGKNYQLGYGYIDKDGAPYIWWTATESRPR